MTDKQLDCVVLGYNEPPFERYESLIRAYGVDSEAYRDLQFSFVEIDDRKLTYVDLLNEVAGLGNGNGEPLRSGDIPCLAAAYLVSFLRRRGARADYINLFQSEKDRLAEMLAERPLCVAITTTLYVVNFPVHEMVDFIREHAPDVPIVVGGPLVANHVRNNEGDELKTALDDLRADFYVDESQGELTLYRLVECLRAGRDPEEVPNLLFIRNGELVRTRIEPENNSLDENWIDWEALASRALGPTLQTRTARSCAFKCAFCNYPTRAGKLTLAGLDTIERELDAMRASGEAENVVFIDDTFNVPLPRFKDICRLMIDRGYGFRWFSYLRCGNVDEEAIDLMARSGCSGVFLGIESGSPTVLKAMNKAVTVDKYRKGIAWLREAGILTFGSFIFGFPGETAETVAESVDFIRSTGLDFYRIQMWYNEPGTPIHQRSEEFQITGDGFVWSHATMDSLEAMDHIAQAFLTIEESIWLPQWSFDFWFIPYLLGKSMSLPQFRDFMAEAQKLLALEIASVSPDERRAHQERSLRALRSMAGTWNLAA